MREVMDRLALIDSGEVRSVAPGEIDAAIDAMIQASKQNGETMQELTLECSSALASAKARTVALDAQGCFKRLWNGVTGKNAKLRSAIEQDNIAAQYAMQQTITGILEECVNNRELALLVKTKLEGEIVRLEKYQAGQDQEMGRVRQALVRFYQNYLEQNERISEEFARRDAHAGSRCEYCRKEIDGNEVVCHHCGTIQRLKLETLPMKTQKELKELSELMSKPLEEWEPEISWDMTAKRYADILAKTRRTALSVGALKEKDQLYEKIGILIEKCRSAEFQIAVVGVLKAGKSMLMNALIGEELAMVGLNSTTAALTKFRSSSSGNYIKVRFYATAEWQKLVDSARGSAGSQARKGEDAEDRSLTELLADPEVQKAAEQWVGHKTIYKKCGDIPKLRDEIKRWTAADSPDHLFASEVEVGVDRKLFDMPEEVVFVDTPGLHDPVKYRSNITKEYIARANAVLVAVKPDALTEEAFQTITTVFDHVGKNKRKVFIVGTQKDKLQSSKEYEEMTAGKDGWIEQLVRAKYYKSAREADAQIITTSAYLHLCMKRALTLSEADLQEEDKFSTRDYNNLENWIKNTLIRRSYPLENLRNDTETIRLLSVELGIDLLRKRLESKLLSQYRALKVKDLAEDFAICKRQIQRTLNEELKRRIKLRNTAKKGADALRKEADTALLEQKELERERQQLEKTLEELRKFTKERILSLKLFD